MVPKQILVNISFLLGLRGIILITCYLGYHTSPKQTIFAEYHYIFYHWNKVMCKQYIARPQVPMNYRCSTTLLMKKAQSFCSSNGNSSSLMPFKKSPIVIYNSKSYPNTLGVLFLLVGQIIISKIHGKVIQ